LKGSVKKFV